MEPVADEEDSDDDGAGLVVDENPQKPRKRPKICAKPQGELGAGGSGNTSGTTLKPGSLKLKLSCELIKVQPFTHQIYCTDKWAFIINKTSLLFQPL